FVTGGVGYSGFSLTDAADPNDQELNAGTYSVSETAVDGWDLTSAVCDGTAYTPGANLTLAAGQTISCTFINTKRGSIKIVKNTVGVDGTFAFTSSFGVSSLTTSGNTASQTVNNLSSGSTYSISETAQAGWDSGTFSCNNGSPATAITVAPGAT